MKQVTITTKDDPDMLDEYDFTGGVRGKYVERFAAGSNIVVLSADVVPFFPTSKSVNEALRMLVKIAHQQIPKVVQSEYYDSSFLRFERSIQDNNDSFPT